MGVNSRANKQTDADDRFDAASRAEANSNNVARATGSEDKDLRDAAKKAILRGTK